MIRIPISETIILIFTLALTDPVLRSILADYTWDEEFLYIPKERIKDKKLLNKLIDSGKAIL